MPRFLILSLMLAGCSGGDDATKPPTDVPTMRPDATTDAPPKALGTEELAKAAENIALVPSPAEMQKALEKAGIAQGLSALVTERTLKMDVANKDVIAVRTGVVLADALLTVKDAPKEKLNERLTLVKTGLVSLGAGGDIGPTIDDLMARIGNDALSRDELVRELDELHGAIVPEIKYEAGERCVPLIQAGSWLEGSNLVAAAIVAAAKPEAGTSLLRQPQVTDYFLTYVRVEGADKAPDEVVKQLESTLLKLKDIASKPALTLEDVAEVKKQTDAVLTLL